CARRQQQTRPARQGVGRIVTTLSTRRADLRGKRELGRRNLRAWAWAAPTAGGGRSRFPDASLGGLDQHERAIPAGEAGQPGEKKNPFTITQRNPSRRVQIKWAASRPSNLPHDMNEQKAGK